jgi:hypothetical protein
MCAAVDGEDVFTHGGDCSSAKLEVKPEWRWVNTKQLAYQ